MNLTEWAKAQGIHPRTAYRWFREGTLPVSAQRVGPRTILVNVEAAAPPKVVGHLIDRIGGFQWFAEVPDAQPSDRTRFSYVDVSAMVARFQARPEPVYETHDPCPGCGEAREESERREGVRRTWWAPDGWICGGCGFDDRRERRRLSSEWLQRHADQIMRPSMPDLPVHPLADVTLWPIPIEGVGCKRQRSRSTARRHRGDAAPRPTA